MGTNPIYLLNFIKKVKTKIDGHFILKVKENFQVFTSAPIKGVPCKKVTDTNIKGQNKEQYLSDNVHKYDHNLHKLTQPNECNTYYAEHKTELFPFEQKLKNFSKIDEE